MANKSELQQKFETSVGELPLKLNPLETYLGELVTHELQLNQDLYDQNRYDVLFEGVNRLLGWSRVQLHQKILESKATHKSFGKASSSDTMKLFRDVLSKESRTLLLGIVETELLANCSDSQFKKYFIEKMASKLE